jgi:hypothetical protein
MHDRSPNDLDPIAASLVFVVAVLVFVIIGTFVLIAR